MKNKAPYLSFLLFATTILQAQHSKLVNHQIMESELEIQDDAYVPNAYNNQNTSPAYFYTNTPSTSSTPTTVTTVQVNVNGSGQNIIGDAGNECNIARNPSAPNNIVIGWRQFDNVTSNFRQAGWAYSTNAGATWNFPGSIEPGIFRSDPVIDYDLNGNLFYNSLTNSPDYFCKVFKSTNGGATWNSGTNARGGDKQWMAIDHTTGVGSGNIYASWTGSVNASSCDPGFFTRSTNGNVSYELCTIVNGYPWWGSMMVGNAGELYLAGGSGYVDSMLFVRSLNAQVPLSTIVWDSTCVFMDGRINYNVSVNPAGMMGQINIDVDHSTGPGQGNIYMLASLTRISNSDPADVMIVRSTDDGATWCAPIKINDDVSLTNRQWMATMSVAPNGRIDAVWLDTRDAIANSDTSALYYSYSLDQGNTWSVNERLSGTFNPHVGYPNQQKMGDYMDMQSDATGAHLAWCGTFNGEEDVYYSHIVPSISTAIDQLNFSNSISIYPNPSTGLFYVDGLETEFTLEVYTILHQKLFSSTISKTNNEIDISFLPSGIYFLKFMDKDGGFAVKRMVKE